MHLLIVMRPWLYFWVLNVHICVQFGSSSFPFFLLKALTFWALTVNSFFSLPPKPSLHPETSKLQLRKTYDGPIETLCPSNIQISCLILPFSYWNITYSQVVMFYISTCFLCSFASKTKQWQETTWQCYRPLEKKRKELSWILLILKI